MLGIVKAILYILHCLIAFLGLIFCLHKIKNICYCIWYLPDIWTVNSKKYLPVPRKRSVLTPQLHHIALPETPVIIILMNSVYCVPGSTLLIYISSVQKTTISIFSED